MNYTLWIVTPNESYTHSRCFEEAAQSLRGGFKELGYGCEIVTKHPGLLSIKDNVIILGAHLLHPDDMLYLNNPIIWNLEQIPDVTDIARFEAPLTEVYRKNLGQAEVWDYSPANIEALAKMGIEAKLLEVGYSPCLTRIENVPEPDIDVLFIGSMNQRRAHVLQGLQAHGVKVIHAFDCYGVKRDALIARAKMVLNVHYYEAKLFEIVRCSYLLSNRKAVVSEVGSDKQLEGPYANGICFDDYDRLVDRTIDLLAHDEEREAIAQRGFEIMTGRSQAEFLRRVLQ